MKTRLFTMLRLGLIGATLCAAAALQAATLAGQTTGKSPAVSPDKKYTVTLDPNPAEHLDGPTAAELKLLGDGYKKWTFDVEGAGRRGGGRLGVQITPSPAPEPSSGLLLAAGLAGLAVTRRRRVRRTASSAPSPAA